MKSLIQSIITHTLALYLVVTYIPGVRFNAGFELLFAAGAGLALLMVIIRPVLKVLFLPINIITLGIFSGSINIIILYLLNRFFEPLEFVAWRFSGFTYRGFIIPELDISVFWTYVLVSIIISGIVSLVNWLCK